MDIKVISINKNGEILPADYQAKCPALSELLVQVKSRINSENTGEKEIDNSREICYNKNVS